MAAPEPVNLSAMQPQHLSIRAIAEAAGVSPSTVSRALRDDTRISASTRERIQALAQSLGWQPDPALGVLAAYRAGKQARRGMRVAFVLPEAAVLQRQRGRWIEALRGGALTQAQQLGYAIQPVQVERDCPLAGLADYLRLRSYHGALLGPQLGPRQSADLRGQDFSKLALVALGGRYYQPALHRVDWDYQHSMEHCWQALYQAGHRRIGLCLADSTARSSGWTWAAAFLALQYRHPDCPPLPIFPHNPHPSQPGVCADFRSWFERHRPSALISRLSLRAVLREMGLAVPQAISYVNLGVPAQASTSGILFAAAELGQQGMDLLDQLLRHRMLGIPEQARCQLVRQRFHPGNSIAPPKLGSAGLRDDRRGH